MRALETRQKVLLALLVPFWATCFILSTDSVIRETPFTSIYVSVAPDGYPVVTGFVSYLDAESSGLRTGDRLLRVGDADLRGTGLIGFFAHFVQQTGLDRRVAVSYARGGETGEVTLPVGSHRIFAPQLIVSLLCMAVAVILLVRAPASPMARAFSLAFMFEALLFSSQFAGSFLAELGSVGVHVVSITVAAPLWVRALIRYPVDTKPSSRLARYGPWVFVAMGPLSAAAAYGFPLSQQAGQRSSSVLTILFLGTIIWVIARAYRRSDAIGRRRLKWFMYGVYVSILPPLAAVAATAVFPELRVVYFFAVSALAIPPIFLLISIARFNLFDINRLISATASFNILAVLVIAAGLVLVPRMADAAANLSGLEQSTCQLVLSFGLAALALPVHRLLRPQVDRIFFADRHALEFGVERLLEELSECESARDVALLAGERLDELLRPESCVIYAREGDVFTPMFVRGRAVPQAFMASGALIGALQERAAPLSTESMERARHDSGLTLFDRAALETLGVPIVIPVRRGKTLVAFVCLGTKGSGDIYSATDVTLVTAVADKVSGELLRFDQMEMIRQASEMQQALRRYVPGAVADQIASGRDMETAECEVSVVFVDIRGYAGFSEGRKAAEIFSTVNRYTEAVSEVVRKQGGNIVEFNGDGMMAVFGAPDPLPSKERNAVAAAREIVSSVGQIRVEGAAGKSSGIEVGVGIATGPAFVGNIQAVDRLIWTAIGNTTNLASRLQILTRELKASIIIDAASFHAADDLTQNFIEHLRVPIRGRAEREDVYSLPLR